MRISPDVQTVIDKVVAGFKEFEPGEIRGMNIKDLAIVRLSQENKRLQQELDDLVMETDEGISEKQLEEYRRLRSGEERP